VIVGSLNGKLVDRGAETEAGLGAISDGMANTPLSLAFGGICGSAYADQNHDTGDEPE
jgi:hypothetical protein